MKLMSATLAVAFFLCAGLSAKGALKWDTLAASLKVQRGVDVDGRTHFDCVNNGSTPITILGISTSCGCTTASPESETIPPGQKDRVWVVFTIGNRHGNLERTILLHTDDPVSPDVTLVLKVAIEEAPVPPKSQPEGSGAK